MKIVLSYTGFLRFENRTSGDMFEVPDGATIRQLLEKLGIRPEHIRFVIAMVNGEKRRPGCVLNDGDELMLHLPVGGG